MTEEGIHFTSGRLRLAGALARTAGSKAVIIAHPHPLYGGDMDNPVVLAIERLSLIVTGDRDEIAPAEMIDGWRAHWNPAAAFEVIPGADHFYTGFLKTLADRIAAHI
jgi:alpha/beta superfamily hydrolase